MLGNGPLFIVLFLLLFCHRETGQTVQVLYHLPFPDIIAFNDHLSFIRAKPVYICGQLVYSIGMVFMAMARSKWGVILFSWSAGIMYSTLFTMPYLIVAHYHETDCVS